MSSNLKGCRPEDLHWDTQRSPPGEAGHAVMAEHS